MIHRKKFKKIMKLLTCNVNIFYHPRPIQTKDKIPYFNISIYTPMALLVNLSNSDKC